MCLRVYTKLKYCTLIIISDVFFSGARKHHVQHLFQNIRVPLRSRNSLQESYQRTAVQVFRVRQRIFDKGTITTVLVQKEKKNIIVIIYKVALLLFAVVWRVRLGR